MENKCFTSENFAACGRPGDAMLERTTQSEYASKQRELILAGVEPRIWKSGALGMRVISYVIDGLEIIRREINTNTGEVRSWINI